MVTDNGAWERGGRPSTTAARHVQPGGFSQPLLWHKRDPQANPRYKTQLCSHFMADGRCPYGSSCVYAHGEHERRELTPQALALRAQRQRQRAEQQRFQRPPLDAMADANVQRGLADPFRPSVCSPRPTDARSDAPGTLFWPSPSDSSEVWAPPERRTEADDDAADGPDGENSSCGVDLARMTSALLTGGDDSPAPAPEAEVLVAPLAARLQQLESMAHLHSSGLLSQAELTSKVIGLANPTAQRERAQLKSLVHLFATGCFSQAELTAKASSILAPICMQLMNFAIANGVALQLEVMSPRTIEIDVSAAQHLGVTLRAEPLGRGVLIAELDPADALAQHGFCTGDVVTEINGSSVSDHEATLDRLSRKRLFSKSKPRVLQVTVMTSGADYLIKQ